MAAVLGVDQDVVVTGTRTPERTQRATVKTDVVPREEADRRGDTNVAEALSSQPGVQVRPSFGSASAIQMQGFDRDRVLVLEDGERVVGDVGGAIDPSAISTADLARSGGGRDAQVPGRNRETTEPDREVSRRSGDVDQAGDGVTMMQVQIDEEDVLSLAGRAAARTRFPEIGLQDPVAEDILRALVVDTSRLDEQRLRVAAVRARAVDGLVRHFFERSPDGLAVAVFPGLCTRFSRVDNGCLRWVDLDPPPLARFKSANHLYPEVGRHVLAACCSLACTGWMLRLRDAVDVPVLLVATGIFSRHPAKAIDAFFTEAAKHLPRGTEIVFDYDARVPFPRLQSCLQIATADGAVARYPRLRVVSHDEYAPSLARELAGLNGVSRFLGGRGIPCVAHLRLA